VVLLPGELGLLHPLTSSIYMSVLLVEPRAVSCVTCDFGLWRGRRVGVTLSSLSSRSSGAITFSWKMMMSSLYVSSLLVFPYFFLLPFFFSTSTLSSISVLPKHGHIQPSCRLFFLNSPDL
jgi:hypothetical protein